MELQAIAETIEDSPKLLDLGFELAFSWNEIKHYRAMNRAGGKLCAEGTSAMLFAWRNATSARWQRQKLCTALKEAGILSVARKHMADSELLVMIVYANYMHK